MFLPSRPSLSRPIRVHGLFLFLSYWLWGQLASSTTGDIRGHPGLDGIFPSDANSWSKGCAVRKKGYNKPYSLFQLQDRSNDRQERPIKIPGLSLLGSELSDGPYTETMAFDLHFGGYVRNVSSGISAQNPDPFHRRVELERLGSKRLNATLVGVYSLSGNSRWDGRANISVLGEYRLMHVNQRGLADCEGRQSPSSVLKIVSEPRIPACCME
ncbi:uncharacterized protein BO96DRAFT_325739 [Aspergillus niger CBS 101883]|uniref:Uncharacterized protein n=2 Tax=Aspergillus niger TaxID=5061 RepID=A2R7V2_ASPNC|nr:uncharacterized protein BO96DRAFT_325739 [Aspergillus niger CBS 101883]XP_059602769.1 hypothetical protein An16g04860 [Aspergillus niger]PYH61475.1 hypothetical protein BO96DRAFT_325739 [Aspergillus niger CBS 101883]CAK42913.1 hypothetical protein An16g04860 [Aspergillus niger]